MLMSYECVLQYVCIYVHVLGGLRQGYPDIYYEFEIIYPANLLNATCYLLHVWSVRGRLNLN